MPKSFAMKKYLKNTSLGLLSLLAVSTATTQPSAKPNIVLILVDDLGYSDIGAYGSEIQTPNIDKLAYGGLRLKEFYNNSICAPTRASLLTGQYPHKAGVGYFDVNLGLPAYQGFLNKQSLTLGEVLKGAGYTTLLSGKWHVGNDSASWPLQRGFDKFFGVIGGGANYFNGEPMPLGGRAYPVVLLEGNGRYKPAAKDYYFTREITNHALSFVEDAAKRAKPFFLYLAYTAPHWPLQALPEDIVKYKGKYAQGWDALRRQRLAKQIELGLVDKSAVPAVRDEDVPDWETLTWDEKELWQRKMEVFAAMVDRADQGVGQLLVKLKELKQDENTLIVFLSDNGAPAEDVAHGGKRAANNAGPVGTAGSFEAQGKNWSYASNTPFRSFKANAYEGGISSPFIAYFPNRIKAGTVAKGTAHLIDLAPTFYEVAGAKYPAKSADIAINPLPGKSLAPLLFKGEELQRGEPLFWERAGNRAVRKGKWKLVSIFPSYQWELYDVEADRGETQNLASRYPLVVDELSAAYFEWAKKNDVVDYETIRKAAPPSVVRTAKASAD